MSSYAKKNGNDYATTTNEHGLIYFLSLSTTYQTNGTKLKKQEVTFTWKTLKQNFIKDFSFLPEDEHLQLVAQQIQLFLETNKLNKAVENKPTKECR